MPMLTSTPTEWPRVNLRWISRIYAGGTPKREVLEYWEEGTIPWLSSGEVNQGFVTQPTTFISESGFANSSAKWVPKDSLIIALAGQGKTKGMVAQLGIDTTTNQSLGAIVPSGIEARYLYYWLKMNYKNLRGLAGGDLRDGLNLDMIGSFPVPLPPIQFQHSVVELLDRKTAQIDNLIAKKKRQIELLKEKRAALITQAVTNGLDPTVKMKASGVEWLGDIPAHWDLVVVKRVGAIRYGLGQPPGELDDGLPMVRATDLHAGVINTHTLLRINPDDIPWSKNPQLHAGEIIVVRSGAYTGDSAIIPKELDGAIAGYDMVVTPQACDPKFLSYYFLSDFFLLWQLKPETLRAAQPHLNAEELGSFLTLRPPIEEQVEIGQILDNKLRKINNITSNILRSIELLTEFKSSLISEAVTGKLAIGETS